MQNIPIKREAVLAIFGNNFGKKLLNWLNPCNPSFCEAVNACNASQPFNIGIDIECAGKGELAITFSTTYNINIAGFTSLQYFQSSIDPTISPIILTSKFASEVIFNITAGTTYTSTFV